LLISIFLCYFPNPVAFRREVVQSSSRNKHKSINLSPLQRVQKNKAAVCSVSAVARNGGEGDGSGVVLVYYPNV